MALQRFTIRLTQLRCIGESDPGPSEPYIWVTYFALGPQVPQGQTGPLALMTPSYDAFRTEFPNNVSAGSVVRIPSFIASASFDMDLATPGPKLIGCVAVLLEQDDTRERDMIFGSIAYAKEMEAQLNALMHRRIMNVDSGPLTDAEKNTIKDAVTSKVEDAVASHQSWWDWRRDQDDSLGFTYKILPDEEGGTIQPAAFDFPEITPELRWPFRTSPRSIVTDRHVLSGEVTIGSVPGQTLDLCAGPRAAVEAKQHEVSSLQRRVGSLQQQLQNATPQQKPGIVRQIEATRVLIDQATAGLASLQDALSACLDRFRPDDAAGVGRVR